MCNDDKNPSNIYGEAYREIQEHLKLALMRCLNQTKLFPLQGQVVQTIVADDFMIICGPVLFGDKDGE